MTVSIVMYLQKNFFLKDAIDGVLDEIATAGISQFWIQTFADKKFLNWQGGQLGPNKLETHHLVGVFTIGLIGLGIAAIVFVAEISFFMSQKAWNLKNRPRFEI